MSDSSTTINEEHHGGDAAVRVQQLYLGGRGVGDALGTKLLDTNRRITSMVFRVRLYQPQPVGGKVARNHPWARTRYPPGIPRARRRCPSPGRGPPGTTARWPRRRGPPVAVEGGLERIRGILLNNYVRPDESEVIKSKIRELGSYTVIDDAEGRVLRPVLLGSLAHRRRLFEGVGEVVVDRMGVLDSAGYEPTALSEKERLHFIERMVPLAERNYNLCELAGAGSSKGSAKSSSIGWVYWMRRMHQIPPWRIFVY